MRRIDEWHLEPPFAGARLLRDLLRREGFQAGRRHLGTLMACMGIEALYRKPHTSRRQRGEEIHPYLLRDLAIERPNQAWAADITDIPMRRCFLSLFAVIDGYSRRALAWRLSNSLTTDFCLDAVREAIHRHGGPEISNTDQGGPFTRGEFTGMLKAHGIRISLDGKGSWRDKVFVERLWKTVTYGEVYLKAYDSVADAKANLATSALLQRATAPSLARWPDTGRRLLRGTRFRHPNRGIRHAERAPWISRRCAVAHRAACRGKKRETVMTVMIGGAWKSHGR